MSVYYQLNIFYMKHFILLSSLLILSNFIQAQDLEYHHGAGASYMYAFNGGSVIGNVGLTYAARIGLLNLSKESSLSLNATPSLALSINSSTVYGNSSSFAFELPISANYNIGHGATKRTRSGFGGFIGAGYGFNTMQYYNQTSIGDFGGDGKTSGAYGELGARFEVHNRRMKKMRMKPVSLSISLYTIQGNPSKLYGFRMIYNFNSSRRR